MTHEELIERGYMEYRKSPFDHDGVEHVYQKCFSDERGKRYFLNVHKWADMTHPHTKETIPGGYEFETQLYQKGTHEPINLLFLSSWKLEDAEAFVERLFANDMLDYYENSDNY